MSSEVSSSPNKNALLLKLAVVVLALAVGAFFLTRGVDLRGLLERILGIIREVGAPVFFVCLAILPALGIPLSAFWLTAGSVFAPQIGMGWVILWSALSIGVNLALTYWLARYAFRPLLEKLVSWLGYKLPVVGTEDQAGLTVLVRVTPGPPFFAQGYLLGLAKVRFKTYMLVSWLIVLAYGVPVMIFSKALMSGETGGRTKWIFISVGLLVGVIVAVKMLRRHYAKRRSEVVESTTA